MLNHVLLAVLLLVLAFTLAFFGAVETWAWALATVAIALLGLAALVPVISGKTRLTRAAAVLGVPLLASACVCQITTVNRFASGQWQARFVAVAAAGMLAAHLARSRRLARMALFVLLACTLAALVYGLWVTLSGREVVLYARKESYRDSLTGTFINRNHFAALLGLMIFPAIGLLVQARNRIRLLLLAPIAAAILALGLTLSRGGILAAAAALPVFLALLPRASRRALPLAGLALVLASGALVATNWERLHTRLEESLSPDGEPSAAARLSMWRSTLRAFAARPWLGYGPGTFASFYPRFREPGIARKVDHAHQEYLELAAEQGVLGLIAALVTLVLVLGRLRQALARSGPDRPLVAGVCAGLAALAFAAAVDFPLQIPAVALFAAASLGLALALGRDDSATVAPAAATAPVLPRGIAAAFAALLLVAGVHALSWWASDRHLRRAEAYFAQPDWDRAAAEFERAREIEDRDPRTYAGLARTEMNRAKFRTRDGPEVRRKLAEKALFHLAEADSRDPMTADYNLLRAWLYAFLNQPAAAEQEYDRAVEDDPANANVLYHAASFQLHRGHVDRGLELMGRAIRSWNQFFGGRIAEIHQTVKDPGRVLSIIPDDQPFLVMQYAAFLLGEGELQASRRAFDRAIATAGWRPEWVIPYAGALASRASRDEALALYAAIPEPDRTPAMELEVGKLLAGAGQVEAAAERLERASRRFPADRELLHLLVIYGGRGERSPAAIARYRQAGGAEPGALVAEGQLALTLEEPYRALAAFERARALAPTDPWAGSGLSQTYRRLEREATDGGDCAAADLLAELGAAAAEPR